MITVRDLPAVNASLNGTATVLLLWGYAMIRQRRIETHKRIMIAAFSVSVAFLICYLIYHAQVGSVKYPHHGPIRAVYFFILITHILLAFLVPFLAIASLYLGLNRKDAKHRRISKWTFPIWLYVSVTGVIVYLMLYRF